MGSEFTPYNFLNSVLNFAEIFVYESCSPWFDTPQDFVLQGLIPHRTLLGRVSEPPGLCSAGYQTQQNKRLL
jgi:hypothetical protein